MRKSLIALIAATIFGIVPSAKADLVLYDNFSSTALNNTKWTESTWHGRPFTDQHAINPLEQRYQLIQDNRGDAETILTPTRQFVAGDTLQFDIYYNSGEGNNLTQILINGNYPPIVDPQTTPLPGSGTIGFWNGIPDVGNEFGKYTIKQEFFSDRILMTTVRPNGTSIQHTLSGISGPYSIGINTHTGHNGTLHFDIDNVYVNSVPEPATLALFGLGAIGAATVLRKKKD